MASGAYLIQRRMAELPPPGCPIRIPTDQSRLRLPVDFRSLLRPSSPDGAKASVVCPYTLDRNKRISPDPGVYVAILLTQKLCSFQGTTAAHGPALRVPRLRGKRLQNRLGRRLRRAAGLVGVTGIGPVTSSLSGTRSNQLSYTPRLFNAECRMQNAECRMKNGKWWRQSDSNRRHPACKAGALPTELCPQ